MTQLCFVGSNPLSREHKAQDEMVCTRPMLSVKRRSLLARPYPAATVPTVRMDELSADSLQADFTVYSLYPQALACL